MATGQGLCEDGGYNWKKVSPALREARGTEPQQSSRWCGARGRRSRVPVNETLMAEMERRLLTPRCPFPRTKFDMRMFGHSTYWMECGKWWCRQCGIERTEDLVAQFRMVTSDLSVVYTAQAPDYDKRMADRVTHLRAEGRRVPQDCPVRQQCLLRGVSGPRRSPTSNPWTERSVEATMDWLRVEALVVQESGTTAGRTDGGHSNAALTHSLTRLMPNRATRTRLDRINL